MGSLVQSSQKTSKNPHRRAQRWHLRFPSRQCLFFPPLEQTLGALSLLTLANIPQWPSACHYGLTRMEAAQVRQLAPEGFSM
jgi:hypothetical protein